MPDEGLDEVFEVTLLQTHVSIVEHRSGGHQAKHSATTAQALDNTTSLIETEKNTTSAIQTGKNISTPYFGRLSDWPIAFVQIAVLRHHAGRL